MPDPYLYENSAILRNKLNIMDEKVLDMVEAEQSSANMMILYNQGFFDFTPEGLCGIHKFVFDDVYDWAGKYRIINIEKREKILAGRSVWYSNAENIADDLSEAFVSMHSINWTSITKEEFVSALVRSFSRIWRIHPFREGNTRTVVMMLTFFVEHHGYYMDQELMATNAGYVRDAFVLSSLDQYSEYEHLERILEDAISENPQQ